MSYSVVLARAEGKSTLHKQEVMNLIPFLDLRTIKTGFLSREPEFNLGIYPYCQRPRGNYCEEIDQTFSEWECPLYLLARQKDETYFFLGRTVHESLDRMIEFQNRSPPAAKAFYTALQEYQKMTK